MGIHSMESVGVRSLRDQKVTKPAYILIQLMCFTQRSGFLGQTGILMVVTLLRNIARLPVQKTSP